MVSPLVKAVALAAAARAFLLPGIAPHDYQPGERVWLKVNSLTSSKTQVPYEYYRVSKIPPSPPSRPRARRRAIARPVRRHGGPRGRRAIVHRESERQRDSPTAVPVLQAAQGLLGQGKFWRVPERRPHPQLALPHFYARGHVLQCIMRDDDGAEDVAQVQRLKTPHRARLPPQLARR